MADEKQTFSGINDRLKQILAQVDDEELPLDDALDLFEEAVGLGMQASSLLEEGIAAGNAAAEEAALNAEAHVAVEAVTAVPLDGDAAGR